jgi:hypothetical protein
MKTFTIGQDLEIDIRRHVRVDGSRFPVPSPDYVADYFIITARWQGQNIDFYPNEGKPVDPLAVGWVGKKVLLVYENQGTETNPVWVEVGTKRGADFRTRMWKMFAYRLGKAVLARQLVKTVGQVTQADVDATTPNSRLGRALRGTFVDPVDLTQFNLDDACRHLRDAVGDLEEGDKPPGTVANIDADFDSLAGSDGSESETGTSLNVGFDSAGAGSNQYRTQLRFPLSSISTAAAINDADLQFNVASQSNVDAGDTAAVHAYNTGGVSDPNADVVATKYSRSATGSALVTFTGMNSTGSKGPFDLTATADGHILANLSSPGTYALGIIPSTGYATNEMTFIEAIESVGTDPATLIVDYTEGAGGATIRNLATLGVGV